MPRVSSSGAADLAQALASAGSWPVPTVAVAVIRGGDGVRGGAAHEPARSLLDTYGPVERPFPLASVTKPLVGYATLVAVEEGALGLEDPAGPPGSTVRHLLAHASGLAAEERRVTAAPGTRRVYSNTGFEVLGEVLAEATGFSPADYLTQAVLCPLGMAATRLEGSPAHGAVSTLHDLAAFAAELLDPRLLDPMTAADVRTVQFPGLAGVLPGYGRAEPNDWGLGVEIRGGKDPHWTGRTNSAQTFGHFGRSGSFVWVDPAAGAACVCLADREFGAWALRAWPPFSDAVLAAVRAG